MLNQGFESARCGDLISGSHGCNNPNGNGTHTKALNADHAYATWAVWAYKAIVADIPRSTHLACPAMFVVDVASESQNEIKSRAASRILRWS